MACGKAPRKPRKPVFIRESREVEYWLLHLAVDYRIPLPFLVTKNFGPLFNLRIDGFDREALLLGLERLLVMGDIEVEVEGGKVVVADRAFLDAAVGPYTEPARGSCRVRRPSPSYHLTPRGGARWEVWAGANWDRYYSSERFSDFAHVQVTAQDRGCD